MELTRFASLVVARISASIACARIAMARVFALGFEQSRVASTCP
jgi:hypothetical protein